MSWMRRIGMLITLVALAGTTAYADDAREIDEAKGLLMAGDQKRGLATLLAVLDRSPSSKPALKELETAAQATPSLRTELFRRLEKGIASTATPDLLRTLRWDELEYAVYFDEVKVLDRIVATPETIIGGDERRKVMIGALLMDRERADGEHLLRESALPLAKYHLARLAEKKGATATARELLAALPNDASSALLRNIGLAAISLSTSAGRKSAKALAETPRESLVSNHVSPIVYSELILLKVQLAASENRRSDAAAAAFEFGSPPELQDPSAMLRAKSLVGPLWKLKP